MELSSKYVKEALQLVQKSLGSGHILDLAQSPLAHSSLVTSSLLSGEAHTPHALAQGLMAVLQWGIEQLKNDSLAKKQMRFYDVLYSIYLNDFKIPYLAEKQNVDKRTIYNWRDRALVTLVSVLQTEQSTPQYREKRQWILLDGRYQTCSVANQTLLRRLAIFQQPVPLSWVKKQNDLINLNELIDHGWINFHPATETISLHPETRAYLQSLLSPTEKKTGHKEAVNQYRQRHLYILAAYHLGQISSWEWDAAISLLHEHFQDIQNEGKLDELERFLSTVVPTDLTTVGLGKFKLLIGQINEPRDTTFACLAYTEALSCNDPTVCAFAYSRLAKIYQSSDLNESLASYQRAIELLTPYPNWLLAHVYIERAWIYIQSQPNIPLASQDLQQAEELINSLKSSPELLYTEEQINEIAQTLNRRIPEDELKNFSFTLGINYDEIKATHKKDKIAELLAYLATWERVGDLLTAVNVAHPDIKWPKLPQVNTDKKEQVRCHCALANAKAGLSFQEKKAQELSERRLAWSLASESGDKNLLMNAAHNLGQALAREHHFAFALQYLNQAATLANQTQNQRIAGLTEKSIGACMYRQGDYSHAILHYQKAVTILMKSGYRREAGNVEGDLAEAYGELSNNEAMKTAFAMASSIAQELTLPSLEKFLRKLSKRFLGLMPPGIKLNGRQQMAYDYLKTHPSLDNKVYCQLTGAKPRTAIRDLNQLIQWCLVEKRRQGPATHYKLKGDNNEGLP